MDIDRGEQFKELCANYGAAMYFAQVLEHGIVNALVFLDLIPRTSAKYTQEEHDAFYDGQFAKTLGNLIRALESVSTVPPDLEVALLQSKDRRAYLAHHFFREAADDVYLGKVDELLAQLEADRAFFQATDTQLQEFVLPVMRRHGFTEEAMERAMHEYAQHLEHGPNNSFKPNPLRGSA